MSRRLYELKIFKEMREVRGLEPILAVLDLSDLDETERLMTAHLEGAAERAGERRDRAHLFSLEAREAEDDGRAWGDPKFRWALPLDDNR